MSTTVEKLGALHTGNYADFAIQPGTQRIPGNFEELVLLNLKEQENAPYLSNPNIAKGIKNVGGNPTIGYGFDLYTYGEWNKVRPVLVYGLGGEASLTPLQQAGLDILRDWRAGGTWTSENIIDMVGNPNRAGRTWTDAQANAIQSITFTAEQAGRVLRAMVFGDAAAGVSQTGSYLGDVRRILTRWYDINEQFPESSELAAIIIMRFRGDFTLDRFREIFIDSNSYETAGVRRAEFWWRILDKINSVPAKDPGVKPRLELCAKMFGVFPADASADNHQSVLEALSLLCRSHLSAGLGSGETLIRTNFQAALRDGIALLKDTYAPEGDGFDVVQLAKQAGESLNVIPYAESHQMRNLMVGSDNQDTLTGGNYTDYLWGNGGSDTLNGGGGNDYLYGGENSDVYVFLGNFGADMVIDSDGNGRIKLDDVFIGSAQATETENRWTARHDGKTLFLEFSPEVGSLVIHYEGDANSRITIEHFDLAAAKTDAGYLGIRLQSQEVEVALQESYQGDFWETIGANQRNLAGLVSTIQEGTERLFSVSLRSAAQAGDTLRINLAGLSGAELLGANGARVEGNLLTLEAGQTQAFFIVRVTELSGNANGTLSVDYVSATGEAVTSNQFGIAALESGNADRVIEGDYSARVQTSLYDLYRQEILVIREDKDDLYVFDDLDNPARATTGRSYQITDNVLFGSNGNETINGLSGNDALGGKGGNDKLNGGEGDDLIAGGAGSDVIDGGAGNDFIFSAADLGAGAAQEGPKDVWATWGARPAGAVVLGQGATWGFFQMGVSVFDWSWSGLELNTNKETNSADTIDGGAGNDLIVASWGNDTVRGGDGDNLILGLAGNDTLYGGKDRDIIDGDGDARAEETPDAAPGANRCAYDPELPF